MAKAPVTRLSKPAAMKKANTGAMNTPSSGWARKPLTQSRCFVLWCTAWKRQNSGTVCDQRCVQ